MKDKFAGLYVCYGCDGECNFIMPPGSERGPSFCPIMGDRVRFKKTKAIKCRKKNP